MSSETSSIPEAVAQPSPTPDAAQTPDNAPSQPSAPEAPTPPGPEVTRNLRQDEAAQVGERLLFERINTTPEDQLDPTERLLKISIGLQGKIEGAGDLARVIHEAQIPDPNKPPLMVSDVPINGVMRRVRIIQIHGESVNQNGVAMASVDCKYSTVANGNEATAPVPVRWEQIRDGLVVSDRDNLIATFTDEGEKTMVQSYAANLAGEKPGEPFSDANLDATTETITKLAQENGLPTIDDVDTFLKTLAPKIEPGKTPTPEEQAEIDRIAKIRSELPNVIVANDEVLQTVLTLVDAPSVDISAAQATSDLASLEKEATELMGKLRDKNLPFTESEKYKADLDVLMQKRERLQIQRDIAALSEGGDIKDGIKKYFELLANGQIPKDIAKKFREGLRTGDMDKVFESLAAPVKKPNESAEEFKKRQEKFLTAQERRKKLKKGGGFLGLLIVLATQTVTAEFKSDFTEATSGAKR